MPSETELSILMVFIRFSSEKRRRRQTLYFLARENQETKHPKQSPVRLRKIRTLLWRIRSSQVKILKQSTRINRSKTGNDNKRFMWVIKIALQNHLYKRSTKIITYKNSLTFLDRSTDPFFYLIPTISLLRVVNFSRVKSAITSKGENRLRAKINELVFDDYSWNESTKKCVYRHIEKQSNSNDIDVINAIF